MDAIGSQFKTILVIKLEVWLQSAFPTPISQSKYYAMSAQCHLA